MVRSDQPAGQAVGKSPHRSLVRPDYSPRQGYRCAEQAEKDVRERIAEPMVEAGSKTGIPEIFAELPA